MPTTADIYYHLYEGSKSGFKPPVVLIHGAGGTHLYWPAEIRRLPGYRVFAPDLPGHGKSGGQGFQQVEAYCSKLMSWLDELEIHRLVMVGHSMGSAIALMTALKFPERLEGLVVIGGGARLKVASQLLEAAEIPTTWLNAVKMIVDWSFSEQTSERLKLLARQRMAEGRSSVLLGDLQACSVFDVSDQISQIQVPTLVLCGSEDRMTPPRNSEFLAERIHQSTFERIAGAGHMAQLEKPGEVASRILEFLAGIQYR